MSDFYSLTSVPDFAGLLANRDFAHDGFVNCVLSIAYNFTLSIPLDKYITTWLYSDMKSFVGLFKAMSDESRQKILLLLDKGNLSVGEIANKVKLSQPNTSGHLTVLKNAGLVISSKTGNSVIYSIDKKWFIKCCGDFFCNFRVVSIKGDKNICK